MKILFTLDYELFLGSRTGTVEECLVKPLNLYLDKVEKYGLRFTIFVDAAYLFALKRGAKLHEKLRHDFQTVSAHLLFLQERGHDIQLHIHPQWYFSTFTGTEWKLDVTHYKLSDVAEEEMQRLFRESKSLLDNLLGKQTIAYRAGGFSAQPTGKLTALFRQNDLLCDSSVCPGVKYSSNSQRYDYTTVPNKTFYRFENDICQEETNGGFLEIPITMHEVSPLFHWKLAFVRLAQKFGLSSFHSTFGNGLGVVTTNESILERLSKRVNTMATIDGYKIQFLKAAISQQEKNSCDLMCIIGHPKLATPYSVDCIESVCCYIKEHHHEFCTFSDLLDKLD